MSKESDMVSNGHKRLIRLNELEVALGIIVSIVAVAAAVGSWWILPYRVGELEKSMAAIRADIVSVQRDGYQNRELLIRIDERLMAVQRALKIPTDTIIKP